MSRKGIRMFNKASADKDGVDTIRDLYAFKSRNWS